MDYQEKVNFLKRYKQIDDEINQLLLEKREVFSLGTKITPTYSDMPKGTGASDKVQSTVEKLEEHERKIDVKIDDWYEAKLNIEKAIHTVESDTLRLLLRYRYINGWTWEKIAVEMNYAYRNVTRLHGKAINLIKI
jgi:hypothetical protein|nr:MAG TPA: Protein of unknown function (DUF722) [Caudoviricetes sp.]